MAGYTATYKLAGYTWFHSFCFTPKYVLDMLESLFLAGDLITVPWEPKPMKSMKVLHHQYMGEITPKNEGFMWVPMVNPVIPGGYRSFIGSLNLQVVYHKAARDWANDTLWLLGRPF